MPADIIITEPMGYDVDVRRFEDVLGRVKAKELFRLGSRISVCLENKEQDDRLNLF